jgi:hypothetical protein
MENYYQKAHLEERTSPEAEAGFGAHELSQLITAANTAF